MKVERYSFLILLFPLLGFLINIFAAKYVSRKGSGVVAVLAVLASFILAVGLFLTSKGAHTQIYFTWIQTGNFSIPFELLIDPLSITMMLIITGVSLLIHIYSIGYMHDDERIHTFFAYMNLFVCFMLLLVLGANYPVMFIGWEGVGLCSYLLIGFWYKSEENNNAARKAFVMNRIGDLGFLLGMILIFYTFGSFRYSDIFSVEPEFISGNITITAITVLLLFGALGKSAQIPLYTWLPDAMAGPTPVSALIHAATMVTAGIYMIARSSLLFSYSEMSMSILLIIGLATAIWAATIGLFQNDIKKVLAYSTISQLGYMFFALGLGAFSTAMFHLTMHAFFKALLFLCAGSIIHALHGEQDIRKMGGLKKYLPVTYVTFFIAMLAISGLPPFSGFFSKDEILAKAFENNIILWVFGIVGALLTAFYMFRLFWLTFYGEYRGTNHQMEHINESPKVMTIPLIILAVLSFAGGFLNIPELFGGDTAFATYLSPVLHFRSTVQPLHAETEWAILIVSLAMIGWIIYYTFMKFYKNAALPIDESTMNVLQKLIYRKYYIDEIYIALFVKPYSKISEMFSAVVEQKLMNGIVNGTGNISVSFGKIIKQIQSGNISLYLFLMISGILLILFFNIYFIL